ncbi:SIMPL domain-containing protein [Bacillus sp. REN10]|uniref:SIMPL domain-containing protein n=1 Tax=Bacillus sp. REN10 TaxID=2782541 RepID=UPI00193AF994|nr:SIMPL domain-containing protein [Bacillus sp. REN10]
MKYDESRAHTMTVEGKATVTTAPDQAIITIGVVSEAKQVIEAQQQNSSISHQIIQALNKSGIPSNDIKTKQYSVRPVYQYTEGKSILTGYEVRHLLEVQVNQLNQIGTILTIATENGANIIEDITFKTSTPHAAYRKALQLATLDAIGKAKELAKTLRVQLNETPHHLIERSAHVQPRPMEKMVLAASTESVPIEPGELSFSATVEAVFVYANF